MNTLVVVDLPGGLVSVMMSDLALPPTRGSFFVFEDHRYEVTEVVEFLGSRTRDGRRLSADQKLLSLLETVYGAGKGAEKLAGKKDVGYTDKPAEVTPGGIILPDQPDKQEYDHVVLLRTKSAVPGFTPMRLNAAGSVPDEQQDLILIESPVKDEQPDGE